HSGTNRRGPWSAAAICLAFFYLECLRSPGRLHRLEPDPLELRGDELLGHVITRDGGGANASDKRRHAQLGGEGGVPLELAGNAGQLVLQQVSTQQLLNSLRPLWATECLAEYLGVPAFRRPVVGARVEVRRRRIVAVTDSAVTE